MILYLWTRYAISHIKIGNFHDDFMFLNKWHHFYTQIGKFPDNFMSWTRYVLCIKWIFCIFRVRCKKLDGNNWRSMLSWSVTRKTPKSTKINLCKNSAMATICSTNNNDVVRCQEAVGIVCHKTCYNDVVIITNFHYTVSTYHYIFSN